MNAHLRLISLVFIVLLSAAQALCLQAMTKQTRFKIEKLSTPAIVIGNKTLRVGQTFAAGDEIKWEADAQSLLAKNVDNGELLRFSAHVSKAKGGIKSLFDLYQQSNQASTRGQHDHVRLSRSPRASLFPEKRIALVIGNQNYRYLAPLRSAQKDAEDISATLASLGFDIIELYETSYPELMAGINKFAGLARSYDVALLYYAGHGIQEENINYLVPVDNPLDRKADLRDCASCNEIVDKIEDSDCPSKIFYFDACRDRKTSWSRSVLNGLSAMEGGAGTVIVFATQSGNVALDGDRDSNSPFAKMLIKNMQVPRLSFPEMMSALVRDTYKYTDRKQYPVKVGDLIDDFQFNPATAADAKPAGKATSKADEALRLKEAGNEYADNGQYELAMECYTKAAEAGNSDAMLNIGLLYEQGEGVSRDYAKALEWFYKSANAGNDKAMFSIGVMHYLGEGVRRDYAKAMEWYTKAAEAGNGNAMTLIAAMYYDGEGVSRDFGKALKWFQKAAEAGNNIAMVSIAIMHYHGEGVSRDYAKAFEWYKKAAEAGNSDAMYDVASMYYKGEGVDCDYAKAFEWFKKAADAGNDKAMTLVGSFYHDGLGVSQDYAKALEWYTKAAEAGNSIAMHNIGEMYGRGVGVNHDMSKALEWYTKAADAGNIDAMFYVGVMYYRGEGTYRDLSKALEWYTKAADNGHSDAMLSIGDMYNTGDGVSRDYAKAMEWYKKAVENGNSGAMHSIGLMYYKGEGVSRDYAKAMEWYLKAADAGNTNAMNTIGFAYETGEIIGRDYAKAMEWYMKAANLGDTIAMYSISNLYEKGLGVPKDMQKAREWKDKAGEKFWIN